MTDGSETACCGLSSTGVRLGVLALLLGLAALALKSAPRVGISTAADLSLETSPEGASVFLNGRLAGVTPLTVKALRLGAYGMRLEKDGYAPLTRMLTLDREGSKVQESLVALPTAHLSVDAKPDGAEVLLDGELQGHTPLELQAVTAGGHELVVRKTNFHPFVRQIDVRSGEPLVYRFQLDDIVLEMLNGNIAKENTRVAHYMDLGHYLFVNDHLGDASGAYGKALEVSAERLTFAKDVPAVEQQLLERLRNEDRSRLTSQISLKESWPGKDVSAFTKALEARRWELIEQHIKEWWWVAEQASFYSSVSPPRLDEAQKVLFRFIDANRGDKNISLDPPYITLLNVRLKSRKLPAVQETAATLFEQFKHNPEMLRQSGDAVTGAAANIDAKERNEAYDLAERFYRAAILACGETKNADMESLCEFQLAQELALVGKLDEAIALYRTAIGKTKDDTTRELRLSKLADAHRSKHEFDEAKKILNDLAASPRANIASKAKQDLTELASVESASKSK